MGKSEFERLVADALATIPRRFRDAMQNLAIVVQDEPSAELLEEMEIEPPDTLFGLYHGTPLTERTWGYGNSMPDQILIFQGPHEREAENQDDRPVWLHLADGPGRRRPSQLRHRRQRSRRRRIRS
ncbi:MAG: metallopeptidase family protein, partial [Vicinamibacterales bacterium]